MIPSQYKGGRGDGAIYGGTPAGGGYEYSVARKIVSFFVADGFSYFYRSPPPAPQHPFHSLKESLERKYRWRERGPFPRSSYHEVKTRHQVSLRRRQVRQVCSIAAGMYVICALGVFNMKGWGAKGCFRGKALRQREVQCRRAILSLFNLVG